MRNKKWKTKKNGYVKIQGVWFECKAKEISIIMKNNAEVTIDGEEGFIECISMITDLPPQKA